MLPRLSRLTERSIFDHPCTARGWLLWLLDMAALSAGVLIAGLSLTAGGVAVWRLFTGAW